MDPSILYKKGIENKSRAQDIKPNLKYKTYPLKNPGISLYLEELYPPFLPLIGKNVLHFQITIF